MPRYLGQGKPARIAWVLAAGFLVAFVVLPLIFISLSKGMDRGAFVCRARVVSPLAETLNGELEFLLMDPVAGSPPAGGRFVVALDHGYTRGIPDTADPSKQTFDVGEDFWLEGRLMDRDTFFGPQYLFFGYPELYVSQVRSGTFWPAQLDRLRTLYLAPVSSVGVVYLVWDYPFMEGYNLGSWLLVVARFILVAATLAALTLWLRRRARRALFAVVIVGVYVLLALLLAAGPR